MLFISIFIQENSTMLACLFFYHKELEQNLFFLALFKAVILQFFTTL